MSKKALKSLVPMLVLALSAGGVFAADGRISSQQLAKFGLGGMKMLSDAGGMKVRGSGCQGSTSPTPPIVDTVNVTATRLSTHASGRR
jgi:hypothetical protein